jgi:hypothetical protein
MSNKFYAVNRITGERWKPQYSKKQYLIMWDSGYLGVATDIDWEGTHIEPLDYSVWKPVFKKNFVKKIIIDKIFNK